MVCNFFCKLSKADDFFEFVNTHNRWKMCVCVCVSRFNDESIVLRS